MTDALGERVARRDSADEGHRYEAPAGDVPPTPSPPPGPAAAQKKHIGRRARVLLIASVPLALAGVGAYRWWTAPAEVSTDNAYLQMDKVAVASEVGGRLIMVAVRENDTVKAGDLLFRIDPEPMQLAVAEANAAIDAARAEQGTLDAGVRTSRVDIGAAREDIAFAEATFQRQAALMEKGFTTRASYDAARHAVAQARERLSAAQAEAAAAAARAAPAPGAGINPAEAGARVRRDQALVALSRTEVRAPVAGRVAQADRLQRGQTMVAGVPVLTIVQTGGAFVEANFKETDLADMALGQPARVRFDAFPGVEATGRVASIGAGTGSEFAVLPAQNATGNWVKVTQRVPVRIAIDALPERARIAGLSVTVTVSTATRTAR